MKHLKLLAGGVLAFIGFAILLLPGPLGWPGIPFLVVGLLLILSSDRGARRWFIGAARQDKLMFGPFRRFLRRRAAKRFAARIMPD